MKNFKYLGFLLAIVLICSACSQNNSVTTATSGSIDIHSAANSVVSARVSEAEEYHNNIIEARASKTTQDTTIQPTLVDMDVPYWEAFKQYLNSENMSISASSTSVINEDGVSSITVSSRYYLGSSSEFGSYYARDTFNVNQEVRYRKNYGYYDVCSEDKTYEYVNDMSTPVWYDWHPAQIILQLARNVYNGNSVELQSVYSDSDMGFDCTVYQYSTLNDAELLVYVDKELNLPRAIRYSVTNTDSMQLIDSVMLNYNTGFSKENMKIPEDYTERDTDR